MPVKRATLDLTSSFPLFIVWISLPLFLFLLSETTGAAVLAKEALYLNCQSGPFNHLLTSRLTPGGETIFIAKPLY